MTLSFLWYALQFLYIYVNKLEYDAKLSYGNIKIIMHAYSKFSRYAGQLHTLQFLIEVPFPLIVHLRPLFKKHVAIYDKFYGE